MKNKKNCSGLNCKNCKQKCCEGYLLAKSLDSVILLPLTRKEIDVNGIPLIRITDRLWRCKWFNKKTGKCNIYYKRPLICKSWYCIGHEIHKNPDKLKKKQSKMKRTEKGDKNFSFAFPIRLQKKRY